MVVAPDSGYAKMARRFARRLGGGFALADKTRPGHDEEVEVFGLLGDVAGRDAVLVDDFIASGGTLVEAAERLVERGARSVIAASTHAVFSGDAAAKIAASPIERVIVTDTVENQPHPLGGKVEVVSVAATLRGGDQARPRPRKHQRALQRMIGTVPPSALQAAPVT